MIRFSDGVEFDLSGELRIASRFDGYYLVGENSLIPLKRPSDLNNLWSHGHIEIIASSPQNIEFVWTKTGIRQVLDFKLFV